MTTITSAGTYGAGDYTLGSNMTLAGSALTFTGTATLDLNGKTITDTTGGNAWTYGVTLQGADSVVYDSKGNGKITGFRVGVKAEASGCSLRGLDLSGNRYFGAWLSANNCSVIGGRIGSIGGVTDEKYAIAVQCDAQNPLVYGVAFDEMYPQAGYTGTGAGEGLPVNFAASSVNGVMRRCVSVNTVPKVNTYGMFGGSGGGHTVEDCTFWNFWRAAASSNVGTVVMRRNFAWLRSNISGSLGFSCLSSGVEENVAIGYEDPFSQSNLPKNVSVFIPSFNSVVTAPDPASVTEPMNVALGGSFGNVDSKTVRVRIKAAQLSVPSGPVTKIRFALKGHADEGLTLAKIYAGAKSAGGDAYDAASLVPLKFSGQGVATIPANTVVWSDWIDMAWDKTSDLIVSFYCNAGPNADRLAAALSSPVADSYLKTDDYASSPNESGFTAFAGYLCLVTAIQTDGL